LGKFVSLDGINCVFFLNTYNFFHFFPENNGFARLRGAAAPPSLLPSSYNYELLSLYKSDARPVARPTTSKQQREIYLLKSNIQICSESIVNPHWLRRLLQCLILLDSWKSYLIQVNLHKKLAYLFLCKFFLFQVSCI